MRQTAKRRARNTTTKRGLRTALKAFTTNKTTGDLRKAQSEIDTAVKKNLISKNAAARKKSQLVRIAKDAGAKVTSEAKKATAKPAATPKKAAPAKKPATKPTVKKPATKKTTK